jgi:hypothetical protein
MSEAFKRLLQAIRFERDSFVWMDFNDRATGDALILVLVSSLGLMLAQGFTLLGLVTSSRGINAFFGSLFDSLVMWLLLSGILLFVVRSLFQAGGSYALFLRVVGFAFPTLLLVIFTSGLGLTSLVAFLLGSVWFMAIIAYGVRYGSELSLERAAFAVGLSMVLWVVVRTILSGGLI